MEEYVSGVKQKIEHAWINFSETQNVFEKIRDVFLNMIPVESA